MAASTFNGQYDYWEQGLAMDGSSAAATGGFVYWLNGLPHTRNYGASVPAIVANIMSAQSGVPPRGRRKALAYGSQ